MANIKSETWVQHHIHYKEIDGFDEVVMMTNGVHQQLHNRLRKEGKCNVLVEELAKISRKAHMRTDKHKEYYRKYRQESDIAKKYYRKYVCENTDRIEFTENVGKNVRLHDIIHYNFNSGTVTYSARFEGTNQHKLPVIFLN